MNIIRQIAPLLLCAALALPAGAAGTFPDVPEDHWASEAVEAMAEQGLFAGTEEGRFSPDQAMTRGMLTQVLYRSAGSPAVPEGDAPFQDWPEMSGQYYAGAVRWASQNQIYPDWVASGERLNPNQEVSRGEFAVMLYRYSIQVEQTAAGFLPADLVEQLLTETHYADMGVEALGPNDPSASPEAARIYQIREAMLGWAVPNGILTGTSSTTLSPNKAVTRAQAAMMLFRCSQVFGSRTEDVQPAPAQPNAAPANPEEPAVPEEAVS